MDDRERQLNSLPEAANTHDDVIDGFYDLDAIYGAPADASRNWELEQQARDEARRARESQAVREDIERRYAQDLERLQSPDRAPRKTYLSVDSDAQQLRESLDLEFDALLRNDGYTVTQLPDSPALPTTQAVQAERRREETDRVVLAEHGAVYQNLYRFGDVICRVLAAVFGLAFKILAYPFVRLREFLQEVTKSMETWRKASARELVADGRRFRGEVRRNLTTIRRAMRHPAALPSVLLHLIKKAMRRHKELFRTLANLLLPAAAAVVLVLVINYWHSVTFALQVIYNDESIGYISDESVYIEARDMVKDRLSASQSVEQTTAGEANLNARYELSLVSLEELDDAQSISDKMIENSVENLTHACGIYIDGEFICAVKNEADAKTVFYNVIAPYEEDARREGYVVGFAETIDYVQGLYRDDASVMWDAAQLEQKLSGSGSAISHTVTETDTLESILSLYGITAGYLQEKNPTLDLDALEPGDRLVIRSADRFVNIKKTVTTTTTRPIQYQITQRRDATKYSGYRSVVQAGVNGTERVTTTEIFVNDEKISTERTYETVQAAVEEIVIVGTKTSFNGVYIGSVSTAGFLWPAPSCHYVSSPYGWRSSGWHNGIDLCISGGGAYGTPVIASRSGTVEVVQRSNSGYGNMVLINHGDGYKTRYAHMISGSITVEVGDYVEGGQTIGQVGSTGNSTGPHLHFEVIYNGETQNPKNYIFN